MTRGRASARLVDDPAIPIDGSRLLD